jgi:hypothetical protein
MRLTRIRQQPFTCSSWIPDRLDAVPGSEIRFYSMMAASLVVVGAALAWTLRRREGGLPWPRIAVVAAAIVIGGMFWGRIGADRGLPWTLCLLPPMAATLLVPPLAFRMTARETATWILLAALSGSVVHVLFSFFLGWKEFMPIWDVPSLREVAAGGAQSSWAAIPLSSFASSWPAK